MNIYNQISDAVSAAKTLAMSWADETISGGQNGSEAGCLPLQLLVLTQWIGILEDYLCQNFEDDGTQITDPDYSCLTLDEALELVAKITAITC